MQKITSITVEGIGTVQVSTISCREASPTLPPYYWETAILWPKGWEGEGFSADGELFDIIGCDRNQEDANERHERWCDAAALARMGSAIVRMALPTDQWSTAGWFGTWAERMALEGR
jgi:hypothetical protein